jgi:hypothetical protein
MVIYNATDPGAIADNWNISGNTISGSANILLGANGSYSFPPNTMIANNTITQYARGNGPYPPIDLVGPFHFNNNKVITNSTTNTGGYMMRVYPSPTAGATAIDVLDNTFVQTGTDNLACLYVRDPGSIHSEIINLGGNHCIGITNPMSSGIDVQNTTDTPNVYLSAPNVMENVTTPYSPTSLVFDGPHGPTAPTIVSGCGTSPGTPVGSDSMGYVTTGSTWSNCPITFNTHWAVAPHCTATDETSPIALQVAATTSILTITPATAPISAAHTINWGCNQQH